LLTSRSSRHTLSSTHFLKKERNKKHPLSNNKIPTEKRHHKKPDLSLQKRKKEKPEGPLLSHPRKISSQLFNIQHCDFSSASTFSHGD
jgi:hypothetical protein